MHRYIDVSDFRAPYDSPQLDMAGIGEYPNAHKYFDVSRYLQPYKRGYFQDNTLLGLGAGVELPAAISQIQQSVCPVKDPIKNPYTISAALLGVFVGVGVGFVVGRVLR